MASSQRFLRKDAPLAGFPTYCAKRAIAADQSTALPGVSSAALAVPAPSRIAKADQLIAIPSDLFGVIAVIDACSLVFMAH